MKILPLLFLTSVSSFSVRPRTALYSSTVITADDEDFDFDVKQGGVRLAEESAIKLIGNVKKDAQVKDLLRYTQVSEVSESKVQETLKKVGASIVATGLGKEVYQDPADSTFASIAYAPVEAVKDALASMKDAKGELIVNFLGGDGLQTMEVMDSAKMVADETKMKVSFNSLCHKSFPSEVVSVTIVALPEDYTTGGFSEEEKAIANGEVYFRGGKYYTLVESNKNTAVA